MSVKEYLLQAKELFRASKSLNGLTFVCGNEAGDLDSVMCAIAYAYIQGLPHIPFVNVAKPEIIHMRGEILHTLKGLGVEPGDLLYLDEVFERASGNAEAISLVLVDHNEISGRWQRKYPHVKYVVSSILDHHEDAGGFPDASPRVIVKCGSCASLVCHHHFQPEQEVKTDRLKDVAMGLLQAILYDTVNLTWRQTDYDQDAVTVLMQSMKNTTTSLSSLHNQLKEAVAAVPESSFDLYSILFKDYKLYCHHQNQLIYYGMSTIHVPFDQLLGSQLESLPQYLSSVWRYITEEDIRVFVILNAVVPPGASIHIQQISLFSKVPGLVAALAEHLHELQLRPVSIGEDYAIYDQQNVFYARKQIHPLLKSFLRSFMP